MSMSILERHASHLERLTSTLSLIVKISKYSAMDIESIHQIDIAHVTG